MGCLERYDAVAREPEAVGATEVQPGSQPWSHSTKRGLSERRGEPGVSGEDGGP